MGDGKLSIGAPPQQRIALPTPAERAMLMQIVGQEYPELSPRHMIAGDTARLDPGAANFDHHFVAGLMFLSYVKRSDAVKSAKEALGGFWKHVANGCAKIIPRPARSSACSRFWPPLSPRVFATPPCMIAWRSVSWV